MKDIKGYEGLYAITSCGKVWSYKSQKFLKPASVNGYLRVGLSKNNVREFYLIHRLVAEAYIPNPEGKPQVNHKDENKTHNYINNLEWATSKENCNYGTRNKRSVKERSMPVYCVELNKVYKSQVDATRELGLSSGGISRCLKGTRQTAGGYHWKYVEI